MQTGLDRLVGSSELVQRLKRARVGLLAHPASVSRDLVHIADVLAALGIVPEVMFGPEHGWAGHAQDMIGVGDATAGPRSVRVVSLYGEQYSDLSPKPADLAHRDMVEGEGRGDVPRREDLERMSERTSDQEFVKKVDNDQGWSILKQV